MSKLAQRAGWLLGFLVLACGEQGRSVAEPARSVMQAASSTELAKLLAEDRENNDQFGWSSGFSKDGNTVIVGATGKSSGLSTKFGVAYLFVRSGNSWSQQAKLQALDWTSDDQFGSAVALSGDGNTALVGAPMEDDSGTSNNGAVYVFTRSGNSWSQQAKILAGDKQNGEQFGSAVAISKDGGTILVGAPLESDSGTTYNGAVYVFTRSV